MEQYSKMKTSYGLLISALLSGVLCLLVQIGPNGLATRTEQAQEFMFPSPTVDADMMENGNSSGVADLASNKMVSEEKVSKHGSILWP